ncbi:unnamed protein product [Darwinula stevensoni]|uniref:Uncharacterized protein n=1 Tax=Darwinula stevensoni TaxID=69355 RepID=A0A7R8XE18_9CRUS|nr:unnamed protein product [Darwinula stevensoni]CAG0894883.1 unnamed protein product [Darwinula stevensoni]
MWRFLDLSSLGDADPLQLLDDLTEVVLEKVELTGDEIERMVKFIRPLFSEFFLSLGNYSSPLDRSKKFLVNYSQCMEEVLVSFDGWLDLTQKSRTKIFGNLTSILADCGLPLLDKLFLNQTELEFRRSTSVLTVELRSGKRGTLLDDVVFPSAESDTYLTLPASFQEDVGGDHYSYVGALYQVRDMDALLPGNQNSFGGNNAVNSRLLSFSAKVKTTVNLTVPATLTFRNTRSPRSPPYEEIWRHIHDGEEPTFIPQTYRCTFWNVNALAWDTEGLREVSSDHDITVCQSHHLTDFAVLMSIHGYVRECEVAAVFLYFAFLCAFTWMALEGWRLRNPTARKQEGRNEFRYYLAVGYAVPVGIVVITAGVAFGTGARGYGEGEFCWLSSPGYIWAFAVPVLLVVVANSIILFRVVDAVKRQKRNLSVMRRHQSGVTKLGSTMRVFSLTILLGCGWLLGVLQMEVSPIFAYFFVIVGCSQGIGIFIFYCYRDPNMREMLISYAHTMLCHKPTNMTSGVPSRKAGKSEMKEGIGTSVGSTLSPQTVTSSD